VNAPRRPLAAWTVGLAGAWLAVRFATGFDGLSGQDPYEYARFADALRAWLLTGADPGAFFWPVLYPLAGGALSLTGLPVGTALQILSGVAWLLTFSAGARLMAMVGIADPTRNAAFWALGFGAAPFVLRASLMVMSDMMALAAVLWCIVLAAEWRRDDGNRRLIGCLGCAAVATMTRYPALLSVLPAVVWAVVWAVRRRRFAALVVGVAAGAAAAVPHVILRWGGAGAFLGHEYLHGWRLGNVFSRTFEGANGVADFVLPNGVAAAAAPFHPGFFLPGLLLLAFVRHEDLEPASLIALAGAGLQLVFLAGIPDQNPRFFLLGTPLALVVLAPAFRRAVGRLGRLPVAAVIALCLVFQVALAARALRGPVARATLERELVAALDEHPPTTVFTFAVSPALRGRGVEHTVVDLWSPEIAPCAAGDLLLFAPARYEDRWGDHRVMTRFRSIQDRCDLETRREFDQGWTLWSIHGCREPAP
jgi:hypothetical protein